MFLIYLIYLYLFIQKLLYICPNVKEHDQIIERRREQQREQEINDLRERIRNLEQK